MNQSDINGFLLCLSRMTITDNDQDNLLYQHLNKSSYNDDSSLLFGGSSRHDDHHHDDEEDHDHHDHDHDHSSSESDPHKVVMAKATAMLVLFCATTICGATPFLLNRYFKGKTNNNTNARSATVVKCLLYFGGGVLLCTTFLHLLPEVRETVESLQECGTFPSMDFPFVELLMCAGFFLMFLIEELIHTYIHRNRDILDEETAAFERGHSIRHSHIMRNNVDKLNQEDMNDTQMTDNGNGCGGGGTIKTLSPRDLYSSDMENQKPQHHQHNDHQMICPTAPQPSIAENTSQSSHQSNHSHSHHHHHSHSHSHYHQQHHNHNHSHLPIKNNGNDDDDDTIASSLRGLLIVLALSVHELFEGLAIGLEGSASNVWFMFAAVSAHKLVLAFCVGVELIVARTRTYLSVLFVFTFAIVSPIGIGIGMLVSNHNATASSIPSAILQGLACGTLLYVVFFEILSKERSGLLAYLALIVGFGLMFGLQQLFAGGHQHSHGGCSHSEESSRVHGLENHSHHKHFPSADLQKHSLEKQLQILREASSSLKHILNKN